MNRIIAENFDKRNIADSEVFRDFEQENSALRIYDIWLACETQTRMEEITGIPRPTVTKIIAKIRENSKDGNSAIFRDFEQESSALRIYDIWNSPRLRSALFE